MQATQPIKILITGGAGFIGSHLVAALAEAGFEPVILDDFSNCSPQVVDRLETLLRRPVSLEVGDVRDVGVLRAVFERHEVAAVAHLAGRKAVGESICEPLGYYRTNIGGTLTLCEVMAEFGVHRLLFSSSATVYGAATTMPLRETAPLRCANPYGRTKLMIEQLLADLVAEPANAWRIAALRYFNPVGAHGSGLLGEEPRGEPQNLVPYIAQVAAGWRSHVNVFGDRYATRDGTGVRDYVHVVDLVDGHVAALRYLLGGAAAGHFVWNLGTGRGATVLEVIAAFERAAGRRIPYEIVAPRPGDVAECWADPARAERDLGWRARRSLDDMMADVWRWQEQLNGVREHAVD